MGEARGANDGDVLVRPGDLFRLFRSRPSGLTRTELAHVSGLARSTVNQRIELLQAAGLLVAMADGSRTGGRPADRFVVNDGYGFVLVADMGASGLRVALCDMTARIREERYVRSDITEGPVAVLGRVVGLFQELLAAAGQTPERVRAVGIDVPGPVAHHSGRVITPPIMTGWHDFDIPAFVSATFDCPVVVENDVNAMAFGEQRVAHPQVANLVYVKVGTGVGTGLIIDGRIHRGADGAAGDVGHIQMEGPTSDSPLCRCGRAGCVEAYAGGWALLRDLRAAGVDAAHVSDVVHLARAGHPVATRLYRASATVIGTAVSDVVSLLNPRVVVIGGQIAAIDDVLIATIREVVYRRSLPLATRRLEIVPTRLGEAAGVQGLARLVLDHVYDPRRVDALVGALG